ncbi:ABC transporter substrate-binding protein [Mycolicibacterium sp. OfavD-34-C]|uniref:ABC transporter substrate-binding protein n=1 Tax=Mycolicibacterium sp. OfavD-34-C TaxID=2917746 RepID=UPI001EF72AA8|nr:ABC transporter substrate-binding protein [Mycolicibacterium sp. OfavD-34-C]MCG7579919.1 ABC transporter substrate-binding protein [Mycolicibacterium sp. OfavD-34-C]
MALTLVAVVGCSDDAADPPTTVNADAVTVQNCGIDVTVEEPPERVYAAYQPAVEIAHALGISDRLVETAYLDSQVLPEFAEAQEQIDYVESLPSRDALLARKPDFVLSGYNNVFSEGSGDTSVGTRASLSELGIQSWILSPLCPSEDGRSDEAIDPASVRVDTIYQDLRDLGTIFGVPEQAETVIVDQQQRIAAVEQAVADADRPTVAIVLVDDDGGYRVASGIDFGTQIIEHAGGLNAFADLQQRRHVEIDPEELIRRDPDVILTSICCDASYTRADGADDVAAITENPAFAGLSAVTNNQVHPFLFADRAAGVRAAHSIELVGSILHPDRVG